MKIGILLVGASYGKSIGNNRFDRDWNLSKDNLKSHLIDCWPNDEVKVYTATYDGPNVHEVNDFFQPIKSTIIPFEGSHQRTTYIQALESLMCEDLDFIIATRFDISFNDFVSNYKFDTDKLNFLFRDLEPHWTNTRYVGDCLYGFHKKYLPILIWAMHQEHVFNGWFMHGVYNRLIASGLPEDDVNFLFEGNHNSHDNPFYTLVRANIE